MKRTLVAAVAVGLLAALVPVGCSQPAQRTLIVTQVRFSDNNDEEFRIVTSGLPADAIIKQITETKEHDDPKTRLELNPDYKFEIVIRLAKSETAAASTSSP